jgi:hypothetical protein
VIALISSAVAASSAVATVALPRIMTLMGLLGMRVREDERGNPNVARSALERFLQLAGDLVGRGLHGALHDPGGLGKRLVDSLFDGRLADRDEPCLVSGELLGGRSIRFTTWGLPSS